MKRVTKKTIVLGFSILCSFLIYLSFNPGEYTEFAQHLMMISLIIFFPLAISSFLVANNFKAFWIATLFFIIGLFFLYRGIYFRDSFSILDYFFASDVIIRREGNTEIYGHPLSYLWIESMVIYCVLSIAGLIIGYFVKKRI
ncbi:hypothetical protein [Cytobacillus dafuensis]|uniref:Uncharacterized protein n=1 Tax=Cytobacillus dafuensis TaxID=1742359 RepID=A0A5B8Z4K5_CYTDA|nr:hypothetical protein [Cytobacillus dafuensis]QED47995.1 hypothetical protein FSZ17_12480 [Cytobacillus dafuensis]